MTTESNPTRHTAEVARKVARVAITEAVSRLSHLEDLLIWDKPLTAYQWDACETLLVEALMEVRKGRSAHNIVMAQQEAQELRGTVHAIFTPILGAVKP